jgi:hypothetical protein
VSGETFIDSILLGAAKVDEMDLDAGFLQPFLEEAGDKLAAIVVEQMRRSAVLRHRRIEHGRDPTAAHAPVGSEIRAIIQ